MRRGRLAARIAGVLALGWLLLASSPARAVREGSLSAATAANGFEASNPPDYHRAALWRRAAVDMLERISVSLLDEMRRYEATEGDASARAETDRYYQVEVLDRIRDNRKVLEHDLALAAGQKPDAAAVEKERARVEDSTLRWIVQYPRDFFQFGFYRRIQEYQRHAIATGNVAAAVEHEAKAREVASRLYDRVVVRYLNDRAQEFRREGNAAQAQHYVGLAEHYAAVAAQQTKDAATIRANRQAIGSYLRSPTHLDEEIQDPAVRLVAGSRLGVLAARDNVEDDLASPDVAFRLQVLRHLIRTRDAHNLLAAERNPDPSVAHLATQALESGVATGDVALIQQLAATATVELPAGLTRVHQLLRAYSGRGSQFPPRPPDQRGGEVALYWRNWFATTLRPGVQVSYFRDGGGHMPLSRTTQPASPAVSLALPSGAEAGRWESVLSIPNTRLYRLSLRGATRARVFVDGSEQELAQAGAGPQAQQAMFILEKGYHVLRVDRARSPGDGEPTTLDIDAATPVGSQDRPQFMRHERPAPVAPTASRSVAAWSAALAAGLALLVAAAASLYRRLRKPRPAPPPPEAVRNA